MKSNVSSEIVECIYELESIVNQLYAVSADIKSSIKGMNIYRYTSGLEYSADKYRRAAEKLKRID